MTAGIALYRPEDAGGQGLPLPWTPRTLSAPPLPLIIYGASSALGCFAIKLAKASNIHPIIAICGSSSAYVETLLEPSKGDRMVDYRPGVESMKAAVKDALGPLEAYHALDAISAKGTWIPLAQMVSPNGGQVSVVSGANAYNEAEIPEGVKIKYVYVGTAHHGAYMPAMPKQPANKEAVESATEFAFVFFRYVARLLARGMFSGHPFVVVEGGLGGVESGLRMLKEGQAKGKKFVYRVEDTEGLKVK
jgi:NADPH:quinone reductase